MVKHGVLRATELRLGGKEESFKTDIHRNNGHEFDLPLLETADTLVRFDLVTRDTYTPFAMPDEITFEASVTCRHCGQRRRFVHGRAGLDSGKETETFRCLCGKCAVRLDFVFLGNSVLDVLDWVPGVGAFTRVVAASISSAVVEDEEAAEEHWEKAKSDLIPNPIRKAHLFAKDGAVTKVAELLPGSNIVAALAHASAGHMEEATRAMDFLRNWRDIGSPDGALAKVAECFPGADLVAFAMHLRAGNFARALRAVTQEERVTIKVASASLLLEWQSVLAPRCEDIQVSGLQIGPTRRSVAGALVDFLEDLLGSSGISSSEDGDSQLSSRSTSRDSLEEPTATENRHPMAWLGRGRLGAIKEDARQSLNGPFADIPEALEAQLPQMLKDALAALSDELPEARKSSKLLAWLLPEVAPYPSDALAEELLESYASFAQALHVTHHESMPGVEPVYYATGARSSSPSPSSASSASWNEVAFAVVFLCMLLHGQRFVAALLFVAVAVAWHILRPAQKLAGHLQHLAAWLTVRNAGIWSDMTGQDVWAKNSGSPRAGLGLAFGLGRGIPSPAWLRAPPGLVVEVQPQALQRLVLALRRYFLSEFLHYGWALGLLEPLLCLLFLLLPADWASLPVVLPLRIDEQSIDEKAVPEWPFSGKALKLPSLSLALHLDVSTTLAGPYLARARVAIPDAGIARALRAFSSQASELDLRKMSRRISDFPQEVRCHFDLALQWAGSNRLSIELRGISSTLQLPT